MSVSVDEQPFLLGDWKVEPTLNRISRGEEMVKIDPRNMRVLQLLASKPGRVFSQAEIEQAVWDSVVVTTNSVYQSITQLRKALGDEKNSPRYIQTIARRGYRLVAEVSASSPALNPVIPCKRPVTILARTSASVAAVALIVTGGLLVHFHSAKGVNATVESKAREATPWGRALSLISDAQTGKSRSRLLHDLANVALSQGKWKEAQEYLLEALQIDRRRLGEKHPHVGNLLGQLANVSLWQYDYEAAQAYARASLERFEGLPDTHPDKLLAIRYLGYILLECGDYAAAEPLLTHSLDLSKRVFGHTSLNTAIILGDIATLRLGQRRLAEAEQFARDSLQALVRISTEEIWHGYTRMLLGRILLMQGRYAEARREAEETLSLLHRMMDEEHVYVIAARDLLGEALIGLREYSTAEDVLRRNITLWGQHDGLQPRVAASLSALGEALLGQGRIDEAEEHLARASRDINQDSPAWQESERSRLHQARLRKLHLAKVARFKEAAEVTRSPML